MLPKAHLTSHSRMSGWVITPSWLSGSWRSFLYSTSVYCHLFLIPSASVRAIPFLSFIVLIFAWNVPLGSLIFLKRSLVFPILLFSSISLHWSLRKAFFSLLTLLWYSALLCRTLLLFAILCNSLDQWRNNSRKNEEMEPKQKQHPALDVTGDGSKVQCCKEQYCIGTFNVRSMNKANWKWSNRRWQEWTSTF